MLRLFAIKAHLWSRTFFYIIPIDTPKQVYQVSKRLEFFPMKGLFPLLWLDYKAHILKKNVTVDRRVCTCVKCNVTLINLSPVTTYHQNCHCAVQGGHYYSLLLLQPYFIPVTWHGVDNDIKWDTWLYDR